MNDNEKFRALAARRKAEYAAKLARAKAEARQRGKEPFDADSLLALYAPINHAHVKSRDSWIASMERQYYDFREVMTLAEFAEKLRELEMYEGG